jgi:RTX calcium-binding nonapeptide repeat (4 copies)
VQVVEVMEGQLVIGGHFWEVADQLGDKCGHRTGGPQALDPNNECKTRKGIAAYSFSGRLDPVWSPTYAGKYSLVWALHVEGERLHTGGEFLTVNGVTQNYYARLSPASIKGDDRANTLAGTPNDDSIYGFGGADSIHAWAGDDTLRLGGGSDQGQGGRGNDHIRAVDWSKDTIYCGFGADRVKANPGTTSQRDVRRSKGQAKGSSREDYLSGRGVARIGLGHLQAQVLPCSSLHRSA